MIARGELWDDAAVGPVEVDLGGDLVGEEIAGGLDDGDGGLVAGRFDGEDLGHGSGWLAADGAADRFLLLFDRWGFFLLVD